MIINQSWLMKMVAMSGKVIQKEGFPSIAAIFWANLPIEDKVID